MPAPHPVVLTRPAGRNEALQHRLQAQGCPVLALPALDIVPQPCATGKLPLPGGYDLVIFVSGAAARAYASQLQDVAGMRQWPAQVPAACVGPATARAMRGGFWSAGMRILHPGPDAPTHDSEALWQVLAHSGLPLRRVLVVRGTAGREWLAARLTQAGAVVDRHAAYARRPADWPGEALRTLAQWRDGGLTPVWLATSAEGLEALRDGIAQAGMMDWWRGHRFVLTHPRLQDRLSGLMGWPDKEARAMVKICLPGDEDIERAVLAFSAA